jgi:hypothetical protein
LFCKPVDGRAASLEVFSIINHFLEENEINWEDCIGPCTNGALSMCELSAGPEAVVRKTHCMLHRQALASVNERRATDCI